MPHRRCRKSAALFLCGVITLFCWQSMIYPVRGQSGGDSWNVSAAKLQQGNGREDGREQKQIIVKKGETLWSLAQKYQMSVAQLTRLNHISYPDRIRADQELRIVVPETGSAVTPETNNAGALLQERVLPKEQNLPQIVYEQGVGTVKTFEFRMNDEELDDGQRARGLSPVTSRQARSDQPAGSADSAAHAIHEETSRPGDNDISIGKTQTSEPSRGTQASEQTGKDQISKADLDLLARVIYAEARGEKFEGQIAVGAVVMNRLKNAQFPKTIREVIYQPGAFTAVNDKQIHLEPDEEAYRAAEAALAGVDPTGGALYYFNPKTATDRWIKSRPVLTRIGNHTFSI